MATTIAVQLKLLIHCPWLCLRLNSSCMQHQATTQQVSNPFLTQAKELYHRCLVHYHSVKNTEECDELHYAALTERIIERRLLGEAHRVRSHSALRTHTRR